RDLIAKQASINMLSVASRAEGMRTLRSMGIRKALAGITTLEEVVRVTYLEHDDGLRCPNCGGDIDSSFVVCPFCRTPLTAKACPNCTKPTQPDWLACAYCGHTLQTPGPAAGREAVRILLIDDDPIIGQLIRAMLAPEFEIIYASTGQEGIEAATTAQPDAILLDLLLPDVPGLDVLKELRREGRNTEHIPIVMLTAAGDEASEVDCLYSGVDDFLHKPFREELLRARITAVLRRSIATP
ncbi:MAG: response regulator, partial [Acidimicrobiia bacterium]